MRLTVGLAKKLSPASSGAAFGWGADMPCILYRNGNVSGMVCRVRQHVASCQVPGCTRNHVALCDYELTPPSGAGECPTARRRRTCDLRLCANHRWPVPGKRDADLCPAHRRAAEQTALSALPTTVGSGQHGA